LDDKTTLFFPADAEVLQLLHFDAQPSSEPAPNTNTPVGGADSPQAPSERSADLDRLPKRKSEGELR
jgi:hypothetical protein